MNRQELMLNRLLAKCRDGRDPADLCEPLRLVCMRGEIRCARLLLANGAMVDGKVVDGKAARHPYSAPLFIAATCGHIAIVQLLSSYGASRIVSAPHSPTLDEICKFSGHVALSQWLRRTAHWTSLHHLDELTIERAIALLRDGAILAARPSPCTPSPLQLAMAPGAPPAIAALFERAAQPWSPHTHQLFPAAARARAEALLRIGTRLRDRHGGGMLDVWCGILLPMVVTRETRC